MTIESVGEIREEDKEVYRNLIGRAYEHNLAAEEKSELKTGQVKVVVGPGMAEVAPYLGEEGLRAQKAAGGKEWELGMVGQAALMQEDPRLVVIGLNHAGLLGLQLPASVGDQRAVGERRIRLAAVAGHEFEHARHLRVIEEELPWRH